MAKADIRLVPIYVFELPQDDLLLILKALGGRLKPEEIETARLLGDRLTHQRATELELTAQRLREALKGE